MTRAPKAHTFKRGDIALRAWEWPGDGPTALLLHGIGNYARYWDFFADAVAGRLRLVATDARGHGESGRPADGYAPDDFVADAVAVLDALKIERALLVGHSMGGTHAIRLAAAHPERVDKLVVVDAGPEAMPEGAERARRLSLERPERFEYADDALAYLRRTSPGYSEDVYANRMRWLFKEDAGDYVWRSSRDALAAIMSSARGDLWEALRTVRCPVLIVRGTRSNVLSADVAQRMVKTVADGRLVELDAGHNVALDRPRELAEAVLELAGR
ncbi:MAG TPA: alpha/beta hydrolase [Candidatus Limnocylindria bacterium]|nr:alpha/beta hydrolase [Candidatus Limnocylindria bacterium]